MLNLILVGSGNDLKIKEMLCLIQKQVRIFCDTTSSNIFDLDTLWKAESNPNLLQKKNTFRFPKLKGSIKKKFWGTKKDKDTAELYAKWFEPLCWDYTRPQQIVYYSKERFIKVISGLVHENCEERVAPVYDFEIDFQYDCLDARNSYCIIMWRISTEAFESNYILKLFDILIRKLDNQVSVFSSAYITKSSGDLPLSHLELYNNFDINLLGTHILGIEYSFYIGNNIPIHGDLQNGLVDYSSTSLSNGMQYTSNFDIHQFSKRPKTNIPHDLEKFLIPAYSVLRWSQLCNIKSHYKSLPKTISVYSDDLFPFDPLIVFSFGIEKEKLDILPQLTTYNKLQTRYMLK